MTSTDTSALSADQLSADQPAADQPAGDQPAGDRPAGDRPAADQAAATASAPSTGGAPRAVTPGSVGTPTPRPALVRSRTDRYVGGVCGGLAVHLGVDVTLLRILMVVLGVVGNLITVPLYLACWVIMPEEPAVNL